MFSVLAAAGGFEFDFATGRLGERLAIKVSMTNSPRTASNAKNQNDRPLRDCATASLKSASD